ncbi:GIY-YIG nuclease family protein [Spirulina sp. CS-785/01]|uniref:GIY-YIG nuclease family protein n=1 Tax=Spirulina sp. CS-785/01 TaxID=3021716 RepID=UPI00232C704E|nr:GIY-YIG nuclease family protein [Spirulina sp. CS-785/01]MDB9314812.1 GIY-YIG nuclease family protein [Spirulina sp. CS-785/01]
MTDTPETPNLQDLTFLPYLDAGEIPSELQRKIGVYAIFDEQRTLQLVDYSRDIYTSLKQHLVRQPDYCYWVKVKTIERPSRTILEEIKEAWIAENGATPAGNGEAFSQWHEPIDAKPIMTEEEKESYQKCDELGQMKLFKKVARRLEAEVLAKLEQRNVQMEIRFNPKKKEQGLLDLK